MRDTNPKSMFEMFTPYMYSVQAYILDLQYQYTHIRISYSEECQDITGFVYYSLYDIQKYKYSPYVTMLYI
jgi:hypothetical protein